MLIFSVVVSREGLDGPWSSFTVRVGSPAQNVRVMPSTAGQAVWVILPSGCTANDTSTCSTDRGELFNPKNSQTWNDQKFFNLALSNNLGYGGVGNYGFDNVGVGMANAGGPTLSDQVIAGIQTKQFYVGLFGINPQPTNFTNFDDPKPSFMTTLKEKKHIPSVSSGYTAGAPYRKCLDVKSTSHSGSPGKVSTDWRSLECVRVEEGFWQLDSRRL